MAIFSVMFAITFSGSPVFAQTKKRMTPTNHHCQNFKKINDVDDLLYQMYRNLDSDCLFKMPVEELSAIWGIPIFDFYDKTFEQKQELRKQIDRWEAEYLIPTLFVNKELFLYNEKKSVYFTVHGNFALQFLKSKTKYDGSLAEGKFPYLLPKPNSQTYIERSNMIFSSSLRPDNSEYSRNTRYIWYNSSNHRKKPYLWIETDDNGGFLEVALYGK